MTRFHTIFFDVGGTLLQASPSVGHVYCEVASRYGISADAEEIERSARRLFTERLGQQRGEGRAPHTLSLDQARDWWRGLVRDCFGKAADSPRFEAFYQEVFDEFASPARYALFPEVESVLDGLARAGNRLGIISNWDARLRTILNGLGLHDCFSTIIISCETGFEKPHPEIFRTARLAALESNDSKAHHEFLHIGDSPVDDYEGALRAGFQARIVDRKAGIDLMSAVHDLLD